MTTTMTTIFEDFLLMFIYLTALRSKGINSNYNEVFIANEATYHVTP